MDIKDTNFSWTRFWVPLGQPIHMGFDAQGFLTDPEDDFGRHYNPDLRTLDELSGRQFLVLCGEPASGKSTVVKDFVEKHSENSDCLFVVFREILSERDLRSSIDESPLWKSWVNSDKNLLLVIDGVDEGVIKIGNFLPVLVKIVRTLAPEIRNRLSLFLVCRTLDWEQHVTRQNELAGLLACGFFACRHFVYA